ncbi:MAG: hypothetical protein V1830_02645 [Candidatus Omnitrophota bacterium]
MVKSQPKFKSKVKFTLLLLFILFSFLTVVRFSYAAKTRSIDYLPRDQELSIKEKNYAPPYTLDESTCDKLLDLNTKISRCYNCMLLKLQCSDCCINMVPPASRKTKCQNLIDSAQNPIFQPIDGDPDLRKECEVVADCFPPAKADPGSTDQSYINFKNYCADNSVPGCQAKGCPESSGTPKQESSDKCEPSITKPGAFVCNTPDIDELEDEGCKPTGNAVKDCTTLKKSPSVDLFGVIDNGMYTITPMDDSDCPSSGGYTKCWEYQLTTGLASCISNCQSKTASQEESIKDLDCCRRDSDICEKTPGSIVGLNAPRPGYQNNCTNDDACLQRVDWLECQPGKDTVPSFCCDKLSADDCVGFSQQRDHLLEDMTAGTELGCFNDISRPGDDFAYEFVAKSNEKLMVIWQVQAAPEYYYCGSGTPCTLAQENNAKAMLTLPSTGAAPNTYFYTLVKIFDVTDGKNTEVYPHPYADTIMNQKSFVASFSVFAAIATGYDTDTPPKSIFKQGHKYRIKLYYLIAPLSNYVLRSKVSQFQFVVLRARE